MDAATRRAEITVAITEKTGITEEMIAALVRQFYLHVRENEVLGPVFETRIADWEPHLERMTAFWSSVALMSGRYHGRPMDAHLPLPVDAAHFDIWLNIFEKTAHEVCPPEAASHFIERARRIAESLELGIAMRQGVLLGRHERFHLAPSASATKAGAAHAE
jgi:hemoglobin